MGQAQRWRECMFAARPKHIPATTGPVRPVPVERCSSPTTTQARFPPQRGLPPLDDAPRQQPPKHASRHNGARPRWAMLLANNHPSTLPATTGLAPVGRCSSPTTTQARFPPQRGLPPLGDAPRQQPPRHASRHNGARPRWAMLLANNHPGTLPATTGLAPVGRCSSPKRTRVSAAQTQSDQL